MFGYPSPEAMYDAILASQWFWAVVAATIVYSALTILKERWTIILTQQKYFSVVLIGSAVSAFVLLVMPYLSWRALGGLIFIIVTITLAYFWWRHFHPTED